MGKETNNKDSFIKMLALMSKEEIDQYIKEKGKKPKPIIPGYIINNDTTSK